MPIQYTRSQIVEIDLLLSVTDCFVVVHFNPLPTLIMSRPSVILAHFWEA